MLFTYMVTLTSHIGTTNDVVIASYNYNYAIWFHNSTPCFIKLGNNISVNIIIKYHKGTKNLHFVAWYCTKHN